MMKSNTHKKIQEQLVKLIAPPQTSAPKITQGERKKAANPDSAPVQPKADAKQPHPIVPKKDTEEKIFLTVGLMGTGYHENTPGNLIKDVIEKCLKGGANHGKLLVGGPGGFAQGESETPMLGTHNIKSATFNRKNGVFTVERTPKSKKSSATKVGGWVSGSGYREAIDEVVAAYRAMLEKGTPPSVVNLIGFSRGADTAVRAANLLVEEFGNLIKEINIFAFDPVAGTGRRDAMKACLVPGVVNDFTRILMMDENRSVFEPQDKSRSFLVDADRTIERYQIYPGTHCASMIVMDAKDPMNVITAKMGVDDLVCFLRRHGGELTETLPLSLVMKSEKPEVWELPTEFKELKDDRFKLYTELKFEEQKKGTAGRIRDFVKHMNNYVLHGSDYFFSKDHQELFKKNFPHYFDYFFQAGVEKARDKKSHDNEIQIEMERMKQTPYLVETLEKAGYPMTLKDQPPRGIYLKAINESDSKSEYQELMGLVNRIAIAINRHKRLGNKGGVSKANTVVDGLSAELQSVFKIKPESGASSSDYQKNLIARLKSAIRKAVYELEQRSYYGRLTYQLQNILHAEFPKSSYASYMLTKLTDYVESPRQNIFASTITNDRVNLVKQMIVAINKIITKGMQHQTGLLLSVIDVALNQSARINRSHNQKKGEIFKLLRNLKLGLIGIKILPLDQQAKEFLAEFRSDLFKIAPQVATIKKITPGH